MYLNKAKIKAYYADKCKRVAPSVYEALNRKLERIMGISIDNAKGFKTVRDIEVLTISKIGE
jgi:hypothetical protein